MSNSIGLYVHIPFCTAKCGYCDFNSYAGNEHLIPAYDDALLAEASLWRDAMAGRTVETVFFGGGTPSLTPIDEMARLLDGFRAAFRISSDAEVSLEANPGTLTLDYLRELRGLGINRLSIGVQSFHEDELLALDRIHDGNEARQAFRDARAAGFDNVNLDFIYGLSQQPLDRWQATLGEAVALGPEHLSLYALTIEEGTPLARDIGRGRVRAPDPDVQADHYEWTQERMARAAYEHYEISNWARPGRRCKHNLVYWQNREYLALGAGAHGHVDGVRFSSVLLPQRYIDLVGDSVRSGARTIETMAQVVGFERVTDVVAMADTVILGLRLAEGVAFAEFASRHGRSLDEVYGETLSEFTGLGLLEREHARIRLTARGRLLSNELFQRLLPEPARA